MERVVFKAFLVVVALVAVVTGSIGMLTGVSGDFYGIELGHSLGNTILDSNIRYFSDLLLGVGVVLLWAALVAKRATALTIISGPIFLGGCGRVVSIVSFGAPGVFFVFFTALELAFPLTILWERRLSRRIDAIDVDAQTQK